VVKTLIFNACSDVLFELLLFAHVYEFSRQNLLSSRCRTASEYHPTSASVVLPSQQNITEDLVILFMLFC